MSEVCGFCRKEIFKHANAINCNGLCGQNFHYQCTKMNETVIRLLKSSSNFFWTCDSCVSKPTGKFIKTFNSIEEDINELKSEFADLEKYCKISKNQFNPNNELNACTCRCLPKYSPLLSNLFLTINDWSFDTFALSDVTNGEPIKFMGSELMNRYNLLSKFKISPPVLMSFLRHVEERYTENKNPFHNNIHGANVAQAMHYILNESLLKTLLSEMEIFVSIIAALVHDFGHDGTTNEFHVATQSDLAILYNDISVLENYHISLTFRLMQHHNCNILSNLSSVEFQEFRKLFIAMILGTELSQHSSLLKDMQNMIDEHLKIENSKVLTLILHCCDISHCGKEWTLAYRWTMLLNDEHFLQGDQERSLGLPVTHCCDRQEAIIGESEADFIDNFVKPTLTLTWDVIEYIFESSTTPRSSIVLNIMKEKLRNNRPWLENIAINKQRWELRYSINQNLNNLHI